MGFPSAQGQGAEIYLIDPSITVIPGVQDVNFAFSAKVRDTSAHGSNLLPLCCFQLKPQVLPLGGGGGGSVPQAYANSGMSRWRLSLQAVNSIGEDSKAGDVFYEIRIADRCGASELADFGTIIMQNFETDKGLISQVDGLFGTQYEVWGRTVQGTGDLYMTFSLVADRIGSQYRITHGALVP